MKTSDQNLFNTLYDLGLIATDTEMADIKSAIKLDEEQNK